MKALDRKLLRDLRAGRMMLVSILLVIIVGIACFVGMLTVYRVLESSRQDYYAQCRMADFWIDLRRAPASAVEELRTIRGVNEVQGRIAVDAMVDFAAAHRPVSALVLSLPDRIRGARLNDVIIRSGVGFTEHRLEEALVNEAFAREWDLRPGDTIQIILNNRLQALRIVGTALSSEFVYLFAPGSLFPDPETYGLIYIKQRFAEEALDFSGAFNQAVGTLSPDAAGSIDRVLREIEQRMDEYGVLAATPLERQASHQVLSDELAQLRVMAIILPGVFLIVAVLILNILMSRLVEQQRTTVGTLKALGVSNGELVRHYLMYGASVGLVGSAIGALAGYWLSAGMVLMYQQYFEIPDLAGRFDPAVTLAAVALGAAFSMLGALRGVMVVIRLDPAEAMRAKPPVAGGAIALERISRLWRLLNFRDRFAARSLWRNRVRAAAGVFAAAMGAAMVYTTFYFVDSMDYMIDFQFEKVLRSDVDVVLREPADAGALAEARRWPGVRGAEGLFIMPCEFVHEHRMRRSAIIGVEAGAMLTVPRAADGSEIPVPETGILMSRHLATLLDVAPGSRIRVVPVRGDRTPRDVPVASVVDGFLGVASYADFAWLNRIAGESNAVTTIQLSLAGGSETDSRALFDVLRAVPAVASVNDNARARERFIETMLDALRYSITVLIALAGVIFFGSILTTSLIAVAERSREVATLLVMGFSHVQVSGIFLRESLIVNVSGALLGLPLGRWLSVSLIESYDYEAYRIPIISSSISIWLTLGFAVLFTLAAHWWVHRAVRTLDWSAALGAKE